MAFIFITKADGTQNKYRLPNNPNVRVEIGRNEDCLIALPDVVGISGLHCSIAYADGHYEIKDEGSSNGTIVDGGKLQLEALKENTSYHIGNCVLTFYAEAEQAAPAAAAPAAVSAAPTAQPAPAVTGEQAPATPAAEPAPTEAPKLKRSKAAPLTKIQIGKYTDQSISLLYVVVVLIFSFVAGLTIRHWKETGSFLPKAIFASAPAESPAAPAKPAQ